MRYRTPLAVLAVITVGLLATACGTSTPASTATSSAASAPPARTSTTSSADTAINAAACGAFDRAMVATVQWITAARQGGVTLLAGETDVQQSETGVTQAAVDAKGTVQHAMQDVAVSLNLMANKIQTATSSNSNLDLQTETTAVYRAVNTVKSDCLMDGGGYVVANTIPAG